MGIHVEDVAQVLLISPLPLNRVFVKFLHTPLVDLPAVVLGLLAVPLGLVAFLFFKVAHPAYYTFQQKA